MNARMAFLSGQAFSSMEKSSAIVFAAAVHNIYHWPYIVDAAEAAQCNRFFLNILPNQNVDALRHILDVMIYSDCIRTTSPLLLHSVSVALILF